MLLVEQPGDPQSALPPQLGGRLRSEGVALIVIPASAPAGTAAPSTIHPLAPSHDRRMNIYQSAVDGKVGPDTPDIEQEARRSR